MRKPRQPHHSQSLAAGRGHIPLVRILNLAHHRVVHGAPRPVRWHDSKDPNAGRCHHVQPVLAVGGESADPGVGPDSPIGNAGAPLIVSTPRGVRPTVAATARSPVPRKRPTARIAASRSDARLQADARIVSDAISIGDAVSTQLAYR